MSSITGAIVRQHFGNYLKPDWWDSQWVLGAISKYSEIFAIKNSYPRYKLESVAFVHEILPSLRKQLSGPISEEITTISDIDKIFDESFLIRGKIKGIVHYNALVQFDLILCFIAAACIFRMMSYAIGEKTFRKGLQLFALSDSSITTLEFYEKLQTAYNVEIGGDLKIGEVIESWVTKTEVPILNVQRNYEAKKITLEQVNVEGSRHMPYDYKYLSSSESFRIDWFDTKDRVIDLPNLDPDSWILFNTDQIGFYRVNYDIKNWKLITEWLNNTEKPHWLTDMTRSQLVDDSFCLSRGGHLPYKIALDLMLYLENEADYLPWRAAIDNLRPLSWLLYADSYEAYEDFTVSIK